MKIGNLDPELNRSWQRRELAMMEPITTSPNHQNDQTIFNNRFVNQIMHCLTILNNDHTTSEGYIDEG